MNNKFIVVEGLDGSGKTTIVSKIVQYFNNNNITNLITVHEPGGTKISDSLRFLIKNGAIDESITNMTEVLMLYAARSQLLENIVKPALTKGDWVIGDRFDLSSFAYQGGGRGVDEFFLYLLSKSVINNLFPHLIFYLDIAPEISLLRVKNRDKLDRIEKEPLSFFYKVREYYKKVAAIQKNIITINANQSLEIVSRSIYQYLDVWLYNWFK
ncbi:thymidylate kinase [Candidatus Blochmanniella vafra str. BVAF]|uniref:Thymidylate kinase n=1 Tax=Blochmanniella vafra (strain BVAF) TaxID=859654 RepID=E8Q6A3_BLOVB|nr:dTMP kinase [Candidatus Blochmannia vafer]ADV33797.1 thymidylate kinase [Candidatus Blochmannia vafer str. BVAF]